VFHVQLRQRRNAASAFNLTEDAVRAQFVAPMLADLVFKYAEKEWNPRETRLTVLEGRELRGDELGFGRGWPNAQRLSSVVTDQFLTDGRTTGAQGDPVGRLTDRVAGRLSAGPLPLSDLLGMTEDLCPGRTVSERLAVCERTVWEALHRGAYGLQAPGSDDLISPEQWQASLLVPASWLAPENAPRLIAG
jgi:hypothetical protein